MMPPGGGACIAWRLDRARHAVSWDSGEGAARLGGRWNSRGVRAVYAALDAATAILEVAVHKGFRVLDTEPHVLTALVIADPAAIHVLDPAGRYALHVQEPFALDPRLHPPAG